jgi:hypothetical protein
MLVRGTEKIADDRSTRYNQRGRRMTFRSIVADLLPPLLVRHLRSIKHRCVEHPLGIKFASRDAVARTYVQYRLYDRFLPVLCRHLPDGWLVDVGAHVGDTAVGIARQSAHPILCIDADDEFYSLLLRNTANLNVRAVKALVGTGRYAESARPLDSLLEQIPVHKIVLIKTDTDGHDGDVLLSARRALNAAKPVLFWENQFCNERQESDLGAIYQELCAIGYHHLWIFDNFGNLMLKDCDYDALRDLNSYVASQDKHQCTRTIYYTDVLATTDQHFQTVRNAICDYEDNLIRRVSTTAAV